MSFYDQVMRELVTALGAALFVANAYALVRRRSDARRAAERTVARVRPGSPVRPNRTASDETPADLPQAPLARTVTYLLIGLVVMIWGIASITSS
ncbi:MAG TPA: hypothetical protein VFZ83_05160 [Acidimicrobiia bacterium]|nr:hypothetical protein [Acidimicrobiia bacterium]